MIRGKSKLTSLFYEVPLDAIGSIKFGFHTHNSEVTVANCFDLIRLSFMSMRGLLTPFLFLVWILAFRTLCNAFVPSMHTAGKPSHLSVTSQSQLYMSSGFFLDRVTRVVKSNVNKWVSNMENPEKVINQAVSEMQVGKHCSCLPG